MSRATNALLENLTNGIRSEVDSLPIAGKLLLFQWLISSLTADIGHLGGLLAPLQTSGAGINADGGESWNASALQPTETDGSGGHRFRRGLNFPPLTQQDEGA